MLLTAYCLLLTAYSWQHTGAINISLWHSARMGVQPAPFAPPEPSFARDQGYPLLRGAGSNPTLADGEFVCASYPTYGTEEDVAGHERGHLVTMW